MPRGPKGEKRPADAIGNAIMIRKNAPPPWRWAGWVARRGRKG
jgi:hypothetical protein